MLYDGHQVMAKANPNLGLRSSSSREPIFFLLLIFKKSRTNIPEKSFIKLKYDKTISTLPEF